ncbi:MAG: SAM-dependent DNA methyltransferase [Phaeodactylibacter sp.]|nr:SAM-dependent DNA methyltransferase [Phaeodactylibacter sp.]
MLTPSIKSKIDQLWDKFWSGGISNPLTAIEQISYLLFMRRLDEMDRKKVKDADWTGENYKSLFEGAFEIPNTNQTVNKSSLRWSEFRHLPAEAMLQHVQLKVFPFIKALNGEGQAFTRHMANAVFMIPKASLLVEAIKLIDELYKDMEEDLKGKQTFQDTQGDVYEYLLSEIASAGKNGQFRTPRHIIKLMCELVNPKLGETVCDPACGTAGFLLGAYQHILTQYTSEEYRVTDEDGFRRGTIGDKLVDENARRILQEQTFHGYDFDSTMVRIGLMNLMMHGLTAPNIDYKDTLSKHYHEDNQYHIILANPPFKGSIDKGDVNPDFSLSTTKTELLFIERIFISLRIGGRAAVIVPDGVLFGSSRAHKATRQMILEEGELQGVISMPSGVFKPYAGVSTAILIFVKGGKTEKVWFYDMQADGYSLDDKRSKQEESDLPDIVLSWKKRHEEPNVDRKAKHFFVPLEEIVENGYDLSINRYKEIVYEEMEYEPPLAIMGQIQAIDKERAALMQDLRSMIGS